jgi:hypothetical protein
MDKAIAQSSVNDMFDLLEAKQKIIIDPSKIDFGFELEKPYKNVAEAIDWYMKHEICSHLPDEFILAIVAKEFSLSIEEAVNQMEKLICNENGNVDLS